MTGIEQDGSAAIQQDIAARSQKLLEDASFMTIEPQGEVWPTASDAIYAVVDIMSADEWSIVAHFPRSPSWVALSFKLEDRDVAFSALLAHKGSRPIYYLDALDCLNCKRVQSRTYWRKLEQKTTVSIRLTEPAIVHGKTGDKLRSNISKETFR